jgi:hypothetical protein
VSLGVRGEKRLNTTGLEDAKAHYHSLFLPAALGRGWAQQTNRELHQLRIKNSLQPQNKLNPNKSDKELLNFVVTWSTPANLPVLPVCVHIYQSGYLIVKLCKLSARIVQQVRNEMFVANENSLLRGYKNKRFAHPWRYIFLAQCASRNTKGNLRNRQQQKEKKGK